jgi:NADPH:quinone reductase-like Zn-dependent oxidoreductase
MPNAVQFSEYGGPEVLHLAEVPAPTPGRGQVRIAVRAAGVNPADWKIRRGLMGGPQPLPGPRGLGFDVAGVVDLVGEGVGDLRPGDEVFGSSATPAYAEYALADARAVEQRPDGLPWEVAGGLGVAAKTAYRVLEQLRVTRDDVLLIHAAAGSVGLVAAQLARARGARVIGTAGKGNQDFVRSLGAQPVEYGEGLEERLRALAPDGVDAVLDASGRGELGLSVELAGGPDRVITIAASDAPEHGVVFSSSDGGIDTSRALGTVADAIAEGRLVFPVERTYPLAEAAEAHRRSEHGHGRGKLVLIP